MPKNFTKDRNTDSSFLYYSSEKECIAHIFSYNTCVAQEGMLFSYISPQVFQKVSSPPPPKDLPFSYNILKLKS